MGITIRDVAQAAGVSTATVSRALRGLANVDEQTRARVERAAAELDYVISPSASRLASGRTGSVAVVTPHIARWFFSTVLSGVESTLQGAGIDLLLMTVSAPEAFVDALTACSSLPCRQKTRSWPKSSSSTCPPASSASRLTGCRV